MISAENCFSETEDNSLREWILKVTLKGVDGIHADNENSSKFPTEYFCMLSLLLEGTATEKDSIPLLSHCCNESTVTQNQPDLFQIEAQRCTEMYSASKAVEQSDASIPIAWDETFALGASQPDLCLYSENDSFEPGNGSSSDCAPVDCEVSGHAALRPPLQGQGLLIFLTVHTIDEVGAIVPRWQARVPRWPRAVLSFPCRACRLASGASEMNRDNDAATAARA